jgi:hypothetical protein
MRMSRNKKVLLALLAYTVLTSALVVSFYSWGYYRTGSWLGSIDYWKGHKLILDAFSTTLSDVEPGSYHDVRFVLRNLGNQDIKIIGHQKSCSCIMTDGTPVRIPANGTTVLNMSVHAPTDSSLFSESFVLYTSDRSRPTIRLTMSCSVVSPVSSDCGYMTSCTGTNCECTCIYYGAGEVDPYSTCACT